MTGTGELARRADALRALHVPGNPLVLPNVWDALSARLVANHGFPAIATSSGAVARMLGRPDADAMPPDEAFGAIARVAAAVDLPVSGDIEAGYRLAPDELVDRLLGAGAVGCNIEDTDHHGAADLLDAGQQAERIAAIVGAATAAGVRIVVNARIDVFRYTDGAPPAAVDEAVARARAYIAAGADCVYPITLADPAAIGAFVAAVTAPVNIMLRPPVPPIAALGDLGVARISLAGGLMVAAAEAIDQRLSELRAEISG